MNKFTIQNSKNVLIILFRLRKKVHKVLYYTLVFVCYGLWNTLGSILTCKIFDIQNICTEIHDKILYQQKKIYKILNEEYIVRRKNIRNKHFRTFFICMFLQQWQQKMEQTKIQNILLKIFFSIYKHT